MPAPPEWSEAASRVDLEALWARCQRNGIEVTWPGQPGYPSALAGGPSPAGVVFSAGNIGTLEQRPCAAIVGTRRCTPDGAAAAHQLAYDLSWAGVCVVSGLALGIDGAAHAGALAAVRDLGPGATDAGSTVGVAASGVDVVYPRRHAGLWREIVALGRRTVGDAARLAGTGMAVPLPEPAHRRLSPHRRRGRVPRQRRIVAHSRGRSAARDRGGGGARVCPQLCFGRHQHFAPRGRYSHPRRSRCPRRARDLRDQGRTDNDQCQVQCGSA